KAGAFGTSDISITVFNSAGTILVGSTYIGGTADDGVNYSPSEFIGGELKVNYGDDARGEVICDDNNNIYVASCTFSSDFPITFGAYQATYGGNQDGCIFKLNPTASGLIYSTYLGGSQADACYSMSIKS